MPAKKNEACSIIFSCFVFNGYNLLTAKSLLMLFYLIFTTNDRYSKKSVDAVLSSMYPDLICKKP